MKFAEMTGAAFVEALASNAPVPGGGGASAFVGAIGCALGNMVASLTIGKKKYADVEEEMQDLKAQCSRLQERLLGLADRDAEVFEPLARAYRMPRTTPEEIAEKETVMEAALREACGVPMEIMETCADALRLVRTAARKGSVMAVSDAAAAAIFCGAALRAASLNVFINTKSMKDRQTADALNTRAGELLEEYLPLAEAISGSVEAQLKGSERG